jgi:hypothetical protein
MVGGNISVTYPTPLTTSQRGAWARCHSLNTIATPSSHPNRKVPATTRENGELRTATLANTWQSMARVPR